MRRFIVTALLLLAGNSFAGAGDGFNFPPGGSISTIQVAGTTQAPMPGTLNFGTGISGSLASGVLTLTTTGGAPVTSVTASAPIASSGGVTPNITWVGTGTYSLGGTPSLAAALALGGQNLTGNGTFTGTATFNEAALLINNSANTFHTTLDSAATATRTATLQDAGGTVPVAGSAGTTTTVLHGNAAAGTAGSFASVAGTDFANQAANIVFSGPSSGGAAAPTFRALVTADIPSLSGTYCALTGCTMSGDITLANSVTALTTAANVSVQLKSAQANGATSAYILDTTNQFGTDNPVFQVKTGGNQIFTLFAQSGRLTLNAYNNAGTTMGGSMIFSSGQLQFNSLTNVVPNTTNTADIGITGTRWRSAYLTTSLFAGVGGTSTGSVILANATGAGLLTLQTPANTTAYTFTFPGAAPAQGDLLTFSNGTGTAASVVDVAAGSYLRSGGVNAVPIWSTTTLPNSATTGDILYASASNVYSNLADVATGQVLTSGGAGVAPAYSASPTITTLNVNQIRGGGSAPTIAVGNAAQLGTGPSAAVTAGSSDVGMTFTVTTGTGPSAFSAGSTTTLATVTYAATYSATPIAVVCNATNGVSAQSQTGTSGLAYYAVPTAATTFQIQAITNGTPTLTASTAYQFTCVTVR